MTTASDPAPVRRPRWPWVVLALGLVWTVLIRIPLILNAEDHLDSDLAVDGLTLLDAVNGHWRWHYPGTPHMGILPLFSSYPQALVWGANPITLVSGGTVIWVFVVVSTFWLARRAYGPSVAGWAIVPLVFSSKGTIWLSGRITGGHLLTLAWHTVAFAGLHACLIRRRWRSAALLGAWCGIGVYIDAMFLLTLAGVGTATVWAWLSGSRSRSGLVLAAAFLCGLIVGLLSREIGRRVDPYDAYPAQFAATFQPAAIAEHAELLGQECLPRLLAGTGLYNGERPANRRSSAHPLAATDWPVIAIVIGFAAALVATRVRRSAAMRSGPARRRARDVDLGGPDRGGVPREPHDPQLGQLPLSRLPPDPLVAGVRALPGRPVAQRVAGSVGIRPDGRPSGRRDDSGHVPLVSRYAALSRRAGMAGAEAERRPGPSWSSYPPARKPASHRPGRTRPSATRSRPM